MQNDTRKPRGEEYSISHPGVGGANFSSMYMSEWPSTLKLLCLSVILIRDLILEMQNICLYSC